MWVISSPQQLAHHHGRIGSGRAGKAHLQRSFAHRLPLQAMRHEPYRPSLHLETLACEGHAIVVKGSQRGLFHCTYIMSTVQFPPAPQRSARMNIVIRHTPQQYLVDGFSDEETACALQHHYIAAQRPRPRVVLDPPCQYFVEELRAQRREIHATFEAVPNAQSACEHATCTGNILAAEALLAEIIGHALRRAPPRP